MQGHGSNGGKHEAKNGAKQNGDLTVPGLIHDLNNVFQNLLEAADLLSDDPRWSQVSAALLRSVERGKHIAASLHAGGTSAPFEEILDNAVSFAIDSKIAGSGPAVRFEREVEPGIELRGNWAWERVLINLFLNALRAMPKGGTIHVHAHRGAGMVEIRVRDEGAGIPKHILDSLFQPHVSTHQSRGLGLHIVQTIVQQDGGAVCAQNLPGGGAEFLITIPESAARPRRTRKAHA